MDWRMIGVISSGVLALGNIGMFLIIKFNDMKHMGIALGKIEKKQEEFCSEIKDVGQRLSKMEGICSVCARSKIVRVGKKKING